MLPTVEQFRHSPCCDTLLITMPLGHLEVFHFRCTQCSAVYVWDGRAWVLCQNVEAHTQDSHAGALRGRDGLGDSATLEYGGRGHARRLRPITYPLAKQHAAARPSIEIEFVLESKTCWPDTICVTPSRVECGNVFCR